MIHQAGEQLHRQILEGQRRPMKQLQHERVRAELHQRRHCRMAEPVIGFPRHAGEFRDPVGRKPRDHIAGHIRIGTAGKSRDGGGIDGGPRLRYIEPAIARQAHERDVDEAKRRSLASGRNVAHTPSLNQPSKCGHAGLPAAVPACRANHRFPGNPRQPAGVAAAPLKVTISRAGHKEPEPV